MRPSVVTLTFEMRIWNVCATHFLTVPNNCVKFERNRKINKKVMDETRYCVCPSSVTLTSEVWIWNLRATHLPNVPHSCVTFEWNWIIKNIMRHDILCEFSVSTWPLRLWDADLNVCETHLPNVIWMESDNYNNILDTIFCMTFNFDLDLKDADLKVELDIPSRCAL